MKTVKGLHEKMGTFENANTSFHQAARCKRYTNEVLAFSMVKEEELLRATEEIQNLTYRQGEYKIFKVFEPKERLIMALPFYDRVVQHMICNAIQPVFENGFYYHSYACRSGKGMHAASDTLYQWMYETEVKQGLRMYAFKGDISKYFASIPHDKLKDENRRYIGDKKALMLMDDIIDHNGILPDGVGIPVGNLTSQLFANVYGNKLDKFCKHVLHIPYFVRYMDDFIILSDDLEQLKEWVDYALANHAVILFDSAYEAFISDPELPRSIYAIEGAKKCAIEFCSLSKTAGFTGTRCGYTVVPRELVFPASDGKEMSLHAMWNRRQSTKFNGTSYIIQKGAAAVFTEEGMAQCRENIAYYQENALIIADTLKRKKIRFFGGIHSPYIWFECPDGMESWQFFDYLLENAQVVGTPGAGFGENGKNYFRLTSFNNHENTIEAMKRFEHLF